MSRDDGFAIADISTSTLEDVKFRALWRTLNEPGTMSQAVVIYLATLLESWKSGERVCAEVAAPMWVANADTIASILSSVGLLDAQGMVPEHVWDNWFGPAYSRREEKRKAGSIGGQRKASNALAQLEDGSSYALPVPSVPSYPSYPSVPSVPEPALQAYQSIMVNVSAGSLKFLDDLTDQYGQEATARAIGTASLEGTKNLLSRAKSILALWNRNTERSERDAERSKVAAQHAPVVLRPVEPEPLSEDEIARQMAEYKAAHK
jgi:hypothetical protein